MPIYRWANLDAIIVCMQRHKFHRAQLIATVLAAAVVLPSCRMKSAPTRSAKAAGVSAWVTSADKQMLLARVALYTTSVGQSTTVTIDTSAKFQTITGFGAALTDASVWVLQHHLNNAAREQLLRELFSTTDGIGLGFLRVTIGASDFSPTHYTLDDVPLGERDTAFTHFSIARDREAKLPMLRRIRALNPALTLMATPWTAPAWMKSNQHFYGGTLRDDAMPSYAEYLRRVIEAYAAESVAVDLLSVQNEPDHEPKDYPGMRFSAAQRATFVARQLGPLFAARGVQTQLLDWDHNWDTPASPIAVLGDSAAGRYVHGVAWHCYAGNSSAQSAVHDRFPNVATYFTECSGGDWAKGFGDNLLWNVRTLIIGTTRNWASGVSLWNLALDEKHGPHRGGCGDCRGVVTIDSASGAITRNEEYYALAHASKWVRPGSVRVASTSDSTIEHVAFLSPREHRIVLIIVNPARQPVTVDIVGASTPARLRMPTRSVATIEWQR